MISVAPTRGIIPWISKASVNKRSTTNQTTPRFIIKLDNPRVSNFRGIIIIFKMGLIKQLIIPNTRPAKIKALMSPVNSIPVMNRVANQIPKIPERI